MSGDIYTALVEFQKEMPVVQRATEGQAGQRKYNYADLTDIVKEVTPVLAKHGLAFTCTPRYNPDHGTYETLAMLVHTSGSSIEGSLPIFGNTPQAIGSSLTYNRRYLLSNLTGIVTDEDDDAAAAQRQPSYARPQPTPIEDARSKVIKAWADTHDGAFDEEGMKADYLQRYGANINQAGADNLNNYVQALYAATANAAVGRALGGTPTEETQA